MNEPLAVNIVWAAPAGDSPSPRTRRSRRKRTPSRPSLVSVRDPVLFVVGLLGIAHQTLIAPEVQWELLVLFAAMLGLPIPLKADEIRRDGSNGS